MAATIRFTLPPGTGAGILPASLSSLADPASDGLVTLRTQTPLVQLRELAGWALAHDLDLADIEVRRPTLEDVYLSLTAEPEDEP
jgi:ABC-2 type transport system ATP-binding protein